MSTSQRNGRAYSEQGALVSTEVGGGGLPLRAQSDPLPARPDFVVDDSIRHNISLSERRFDIKTLPDDLQRVYHKLEREFGEEYALTWIFAVRTAVELHRAWHMTLLTSKILQQIKDKFNMRMTWNLGVVRLIFRVEDGGFELHRKVPYDYDSEFQDLYMKIAVALVEGHIDIHQALIFQSETKKGIHTAKSGLFLRTNPGRLVLYPIVAATCAMIFFGGDLPDAGVAAACGFAAGLMDYLLSWLGGEFVPLTDVLVGCITGVVAGLFVKYTEEDYCLSAIFLGTLYWFFYGTAFVIGILEIVAGELATGVTRFVAVSVKTFVLSLGSCVGMWFVLVEDTFDIWNYQDKHCNTIDLDDKWWRIPLYLLCSASVLGQYRFPLVHYWRGLVVQFVGYEVQYQAFKQFGGDHPDDFLDTAISNGAGAVASVAAASIVSYIVDVLGWYYNARLLQRHKGKYNCFGECIYSLAASYVRVNNFIGIGRKSSLYFLRMEERLKQETRELHDPNHDRNQIKLTPQEEVMLIEAIVEAEDLNVWSLLMPAVYQLVPGSLIARLWYNAVFPPPSLDSARVVDINGTTYTYFDQAANPAADDVFYGLMVISTSLALGLLLGFAVVHGVERSMEVFVKTFQTEEPDEEHENEEARIKRMRFRQQGIVNTDLQDDPEEGSIMLEREGSAGRPDAPNLGADRIATIKTQMQQEVIQEEEDL